MKRGRVAACTAVLVFALVVFSGCGPRGGGPIPEDELADRAATTLCHQAFVCDCNSIYADESACIAGERPDIEGDVAEAMAMGLTYDAACAGQTLGFYESLGCDSIEPTDPAALDSVCALTCTIYHGDIPEGQPCLSTSGGGFSNCAAGLMCDGTCQASIFEEICSPLQSGQTCFDGMNLQLCDFDLLCDVLNTGTCIVAPTNGQPCYAGQVCALGFYCDMTGPNPVCATAPGLGGDCSMNGGACAEGTCVNGLCATSDPLICEVVAP